MNDLEEFMLQGHIILSLQAKTGTENVGQGPTLLGKGIHDWSSGRSHWCLEHVAEDTEHAVKVLEVFCGGTVVGMRLPLDASHHLSD